MGRFKSLAAEAEKSCCLMPKALTAVSPCVYMLLSGG